MEYTMNALIFPPVLRNEIDAGQVEGLAQWFSYSAQRRYTGWDHNNSTQDFGIAATATPGCQVRNPGPVTDLTITRSGPYFLLRWTPVPYAIAYRIYQATNPGFTGIVSGITVIGSSYTDRSTLTLTGRKFYRISSLGMDPPIPPP
jgi:hypothetical protein